MQESTPSACTSEMARSRTALEGQNGSKARLTSSSSVVTVMLTCTRPPHCFDLPEEVAVTDHVGAAGLDHQLGPVPVRQDFEEAPGQV